MKIHSLHSTLFLLPVLVAGLSSTRSQAATLLNSWETGTEGWGNAPGGSQTIGTSTAFRSQGTQSLRITNIAPISTLLAQRTFTTGYTQPWNSLGSFSLDLNFNWPNRPAGVGNSFAEFSISLYSEGGIPLHLGSLELVGGNQTYTSSQIPSVTNLPLDTVWNRISFNLFWLATVGAPGPPSLMIDNLQAAVPEPSSSFLLAGPLCALAFRRKRQGSLPPHGKGNALPLDTGSAGKSSGSL